MIPNNNGATPKALAAAGQRQWLSGVAATVGSGVDDNDGRQGRMLAIFIANLSYVGFVPLSNFVDINGDNKIWAALLVSLKIDLFLPQK